MRLAQATRQCTAFESVFTEPIETHRRNCTCFEGVPLAVSGQGRKRAAGCRLGAFYQFDQCAGFWDVCEFCQIMAGLNGIGYFTAIICPFFIFLIFQCANLKHFLYIRLHVQGFPSPTV
ncbi:uncharacterized protein ASCRUDRAFT_146193 [Ascoidea rubescens DSM 1968]|uniref:Uncharacterized protein n=1 Tax=Ascoidea rubescens DSM 1968 TaxID=1344418 RepID=A0A1D2VHZ8_9ASCO|nr:hypothetical protein ASCRUDRAFT_146193 [Ascoidea rubescens DSM 1968]ODV61103.1 hypothetical protein ASCRUDRAFT_146193 [Ascoidea rubescens DSM 1968]